MSLWMPIPVTPGNTPQAQQRAVAGNRNTGELDRDAFLLLLVTQMQHQDPLNPMDDRDFIAQMAQFSALEQQQHMTRSMELQQAYAMIGRSVYAMFFDEVSNSFREVEGPVMHVSRVGSNIFLGVQTMVPRLDEDGNPMRTAAGEVMYDLRVVDTPLDRVTWVSDEHFMARQLQGILDGVANARDISLIGRYVQAILVDEDRNPTEFIEGIVEFVRFVGGQAVLMVNGREIFSDEVFSVSDNALVIGRNLTAHILNADNTITTVGGTINSIGINPNTGQAFVRFDDGSQSPLAMIDHLVEGLQFIGRHVTHTREDFNGQITDVSLRNGQVYLHMGDRHISLLTFRDGGRQVGAPVTPPNPPENDDEGE